MATQNVDNRIIEESVMLARLRFLCQSTVLFMFVLLALIICASASAEEDKLILDRFIPAYGGSCQPGYPNVLAGSVLDLSLINTSEDQLLVPLESGWPQGYVLEAALDVSGDQPFIPTPGLIKRLSPTPFCTFDNLHNENKLLMGDSSHVRIRGLNKKHFAITVPTDLVGHTLTIRALYRQGSVRLQNRSNAWDPISIIAPCDQADTARIVASWIFIAWASNDSNRVITLADSMLSCGLSDPIAWNYAQTTALRLSQPQKALTYLDQLYQDFGVISVDDKLGSDNMPRLNRNGPRDPMQQQIYERQRSQLLDVISREQQQK